MAIYLGKNQVSAVGGQYINGIDTSNATVLPEDIKKGKIAYANGQEIIGTMDALKSDRVVQGNSAQIEEKNDGSKELVIWGESANIATRYVSPETMITMEFNEKASDMFVFGDAEPSQVLEGKTFTSTAGFTKTGTIPSVSGNTITPTENEQIVVNAGSYISGNIIVEAIPSEYVKPNVTQAAKTWTPGASDQTIEAGTYCSGNQTIEGDSNLIASNIASGVTIFGVTGNHTGGPAVGDAVLSQYMTDLTLFKGYSGTTGWWEDSSGVTISYGTSVSISDGTVSVAGTTGSLKVTSSNASALTDTLKGKYIFIADLAFAGGTRGVVYIPDDATITANLTYSGGITTTRGAYVIAFGNIITT